MSDPVSIEIVHLQTCACVNLRFDNIISCAGTKLFFHSVKYLNLHFRDLICERDILSADVIMTAENWSLTVDIYKIAGFKCEHQRHSEGRRTAVGSALFTKLDLENHYQPLL